MEKTKKLANAETDIMNVIWKSQKALCVNDVLALLEGKEWKYTTVATFLTRLEKKGFLTCKKQNNQNYYEPKTTRQEYLTQQTDDFVENMYGGATNDFIASLCKERISESDYGELMKILKKYDKNQNGGKI